MRGNGLHDRRRDKDGTIAKKHGNTLIRTLCQTMGRVSHPTAIRDAKLSDCLDALDEQSLSQLVRGERSIG
jgi:hypothetical protein